MFCTIFSITCKEIKKGRYCLFYLEQLIKISDHIIVCVPENIEEDFYCEIEKRNVAILCCEDENIINRLGKVFLSINLSQYDYVLFADDSMYGPFYPLNEVKREILESEVDLWGLTEHEPIYPFVEKEFVQTYFFALSKRLLLSKKFHGFIRKITNCRNHDECMQQFEYKFTKLVEEWGFLWEAKYRFPKCYNNHLFISHILFNIKELICEKKYPFLPKFLFSLDRAIIMNYNLGDELRRSIEFIKNNTSYRADYIYESIMNNLTPYEMFERLNLNFICDDKQEKEVINRRIGIFCFLFYCDNFIMAINKLCNVPQYYDIYIASDTTHKVEEIEKLWKLQKRKNKIFFLKHGYKGRDVSALLLTFKPYICNYDIFCFLHDKRSEQMGYPTVGKAFNEHIWECLLGSETIIRYAVSTLISDSRLGILAPPFVMEGMYFYVNSTPWTICYKKTIELADRIGLTVKIKEDDDFIFLGNCFWAKTDALQKLFLYDFAESDFPDEPCLVDGTFNHCIERLLSYVAYDSGFYTGNILNARVAERELITQKYLIHSIMLRMKKDKSIDLTTLESFINSIGIEH